jgi:hypothetical protein
VTSTNARLVDGVGGGGRKKQEVVRLTKINIQTIKLPYIYIYWTTLFLNHGSLLTSRKKGKRK